MTGFLVKLPMGTYELSLPKWAAWSVPFAFAAGFAIFFNLFGWFTYLPHCRDFKTQKYAQTLFITNKIKYAYLDTNKDGIACNGI